MAYGVKISIILNNTGSKERRYVMSDNVVKLQRFRIGKSTLAEMCEEITEVSYPFITLNICDSKGGLFMSNTVAWARFREDEQRKDLWQVRNNDEIMPSQFVWISKKHLSRYVLVFQEENIRYVFQMTV
jgi:Asp-tRNA(Asn)/Glu-tRNA(Gln) amidotransferase C subunit